MATTASRIKPTYAISYGLAGGPAHARQFNRTLRRAGFQKAPLDKADIIIAHSGGTWLIPANAKPNLVMYVGMPLAQTDPRQAWRGARSAMREHGNLINKPSTQIKNGYYLLTRPRRNLHMVRIAKTARPVTFADAKTIFISNHHDPWTQSENLHDLINNKEWAFMSLSGSHDDIWAHPENYAELLQRFLIGSNFSRNFVKNSQGRF